MITSLRCICRISIYTLLFIWIYRIRICTVHNHNLPKNRRKKKLKEGRDSRFYPEARISCSQAGRYHQPVPSYSCFLPRNEGPTYGRDGVDVCSACCAHRKCSSTSAHPSVPIALPPSSISLILNRLLLIDL